MKPQHADVGDLVEVKLKQMFGPNTQVRGLYEGDDPEVLKLEGFTRVKWKRVRRFRVIYVSRGND